MVHATKTLLRKNAKAIFIALASVGLTVAGAGPVIPDGVRFFVSPKGQEFFKTRLNEVILLNGLDLSKRTFPKTEITLDDPFNSDNLSPSVKEKKALSIAEIQRALGRFVSGFPIGSPKFLLTLNNAAYEAKFKSLGAEIDPAGPKAYGLPANAGVVALLRLEAKNVSFSLPELRAVDQKNPDFLGTIGANGFTARLTNGATRPIRVEIPVLIGVGNQLIQIKPLAVRTNLTKSEIAGDFSSLLLPKISITIGSKTLDFNQAAFEEEMHRQLPNIVDVIVASAKSYVEKSGQELLKKPFEELSALTAGMDFEVGIAGDKTETQKMKLFLEPIAAAVHPKKAVFFAFNARLEDPTMKPAATFATAGVSTLPALTAIDGKEYDVAVAIHPGIVNGVIQRGFDRKFLSNVPLGGGESIKLTRVPVFTFDQASNPAGAPTGRLKVAMSYDVDGFMGLLFKRPIPISFDMIIKLETNVQTNEAEIVVDRIDTESVEIDTTATWLGMARGKVRSEVMERLNKKNSNYKKKRETLGEIPCPSDAMKIPLRLKDVRTDGGNVLLFADFDLPR